MSVFDRRILSLCWLVVVVSSPNLALAQASPSAGEAPAPAVSGAPAASGSPADITTIDPALAARAKDWFHRTQTGVIDRTQLDDTMNAAMTDTAAKQFAAQIAPLGDPTAFVFVAAKKFPGNTAYKFHVTFKTAAFFWLFVLDDAGKISGLRLLADQPK